MRITCAFPLLLALFVASSHSKEWTPANYPNPSTLNGSKACQRPSQSFVCDPDEILSVDSANVVSTCENQLFAI
jgi:hypothetical protein